ncbi:hypothetical protein ABBQ38_010054 [Trebouxia sp. C0009 RCD-2024]
MTARLICREHEHQYTAPKPATIEECQKAFTREACKRYRVDNVRFHEATVNGRLRHVEASEKYKVASVCAQYLWSRICLGKPNRQKDTLNDAQNDAQQDGFAQIVEKHIQEFQPYFQRTGLTAEKFKSNATASYSAWNIDAHPTDDQLQEMAEDCCEYVELMQETMPHECQLALHFEWIKLHLFTLAGQ